MGWTAPDDLQGQASGASFGNGNTGTVSHEVDGDLSLLSYALKDEAGASQALEWNYTYTDAHRLASMAVSVAAHDWSPPANATLTYTSSSLSGQAANALDQYEQIAESIRIGVRVTSSGVRRVWAWVWGRVAADRRDV